MKVKLTSADVFGPTGKIIVTKLPVILGRSPEADIRVDDRWASRRHCEIDEVEGTLVVRDLRSKHGTFVNGHGISEAHLMPGDKLTVGTTSFIAHYKRTSRMLVSQVACGGPAPS